MNNSEIYKRLYKDYSKKYINKILISVLFGVLVAGEHFSNSMAFRSSYQKNIC